MRIKARSTVLLDTSALVAVMVPSDSLHAAATALMTDLYENESQVITTEYVIVEFANFLSKVELRKLAVSLIDGLLKLPNLKIVWSDSDFFDASYRLYKTRPDKDWSLTDCASFIVMKEQNISLAFTSDKHFEQAGFVKLLEN